MPSEDKTDAEKKETADEIKQHEAAERSPRGNVKDRDDDTRQVDTPPPLN
jgi:hypothetical protein